jgi:hypothetical protein
MYRHQNLAYHEPTEFGFAQQSMSFSYLKWALPLLVVVGYAAYVLTGMFVAVDPNDRDAVRMQEQRLVEDKCHGTEALNRRHLQQTWFYSPKTQEIALVFGDVGISHFQRGTSAQDVIHGAYCMDDAKLEVQYFSVDHVPTSIKFESISSWRVSFGRKITPTAADTFHVKKLNEEILTIAFESSGHEVTFYRKQLSAD